MDVGVKPVNKCQFQIDQRSDLAKLISVWICQASRQQHFLQDSSEKNI